MIPPFCAEYLKAQGVLILPARRVISTPIQEKRAGEYVPVVPEYERGDLP